MSFPDFEKLFIMYCDASETGLGAVCQNQDEKLKVTLTPAEKNYHLHSGKLEFLALKWAITDRFHDYLLYSSPFDVYTNNNPLTYVLTTAKLNATGLKWVDDLADFKFKIHYHSGIKNKNVDCLSRHPLHKIEQLQKDSDMVINSDNISLCSLGTSTHNNSHIDINVLQLNSVDKITLVRTEQLTESQLNGDYIKPVYQFVNLVNKNGKRFVTKINY